MTFEEEEAVWRAAEAKHGGNAEIHDLLRTLEGRAWLRLWCKNTVLKNDAERILKMVEEAEKAERG